MCQCNRLENEQSVLPVCVAWVNTVTILEVQGHTNVLAQSAAVYLGMKQADMRDRQVWMSG